MSEVRWSHFSDPRLHMLPEGVRPLSVDTVERPGTLYVSMDSPDRGLRRTDNPTLNRDSKRLSTILYHGTFLDDYTHRL